MRLWFIHQLGGVYAKCKFQFITYRVTPPYRSEVPHVDLERSDTEPYACSEMLAVAFFRMLIKVAGANKKLPVITKFKSAGHHDLRELFGKAARGIKKRRNQRRGDAPVRIPALFDFAGQFSLLIYPIPRPRGNQ